MFKHDLTNCDVLISIPPIPRVPGSDHGALNRDGAINYCHCHYNTNTGPAPPVNTAHITIIITRGPQSNKKSRHNARLVRDDDQGPINRPGPQRATASASLVLITINNSR